MHTRTLALTLLAALALTGCEDFDVVDKSKYDVVDKSKYVAISKSEYEQLRAAALEAKQVGRYQLHRDGYRTWRLDTSTGKSCLLLATEADWKAGAKDQTSCAVEDYLEGKRRHDLFPTLYDQYGSPIPQQQPPKTN